MSYTTVLTQVSILFVMMVIGYITGRAGMFSEKVQEDLSSLLLYIATPALVLNSMIREYDATLVTDALICLGIGLAVFAFGLLITKPLAKLFKVDLQRTGIWRVAASFTNPGFMGFPMTLALFGSDGLFLAAFINLAQNILLYSWGVRVVMQDSKEAQAKEHFLRTFLSPINVSLIVGLVIFFFQIPIPAPAQDLISKVASIVTPVSMFIVGITISRHKLVEVIKDKDAFTAAGVHLVIVPLILVGVLKFFNFHEGSLVPGVCVLLMTMPVASMTQIIAVKYKSDADFGAHVVFIANILCLLTCPLIMMLV